MTKLISCMFVLCFSCLSVSIQADLLGSTGMTNLHARVKSILDEPGNSRHFYLMAENKHHVESGEAALYFPQDIRTITQSVGNTGNW